MEHRRITGETGFFHHRRMEQNLQVFHESIEAGLHQHFFNRKDISHVMARIEQEIMNGTVNPYQAAQELLNLYFKL